MYGYASGPEDVATPYWSDAYMESQAEAKGCVVERAPDDVLQLDIDDDESYALFLEQIELFNSLGIVAWNGWDERRSKSGKRHVRVFLLQALPVLTRVLLQACLGSDRRRELLSYSGIVHGQESPVVFFRSKGEENDEARVFPEGF